MLELAKSCIAETYREESRHASLHQDWSDVIDIWTPLINCFERKPHQSDYCTPMVDRSAYDHETDKGRKLWWYQSCSSHGCFVVGGDYFRGWPSYMIDDAPVRNRIMEWLTWKYGIAGEHYFSINESYGKKKDPWSDVLLFGGNGDGSLFYPGRPDIVGGATNIPIESIRLKLNAKKKTTTDDSRQTERRRPCSRRGQRHDPQHVRLRSGFEKALRVA
jgi:hypothetical protein